MGLSEELEFISGNFFEREVPKNKRYYLKYYTTKIQKQFLLYYIFFRSTERFVEHTGLFVLKRWLQTLEARFIELEKAHKLAKEEFDIEKIAEIESGKFKL